jgi:uncharacterized protein (DUF58 family)
MRQRVFRQRPERQRARRASLRPTAAGVLLLLASVVVLLIAINSGSNAVFAFCFLICGLLVAAALQARRALSALHFEIRADATAFAGDSAACRVRFVSAEFIPATVEIGAAAGVPGDEADEIAVMRPTAARGWLPPEQIWLTTTWPLGLVRARRSIGQTPATLVYPRPAPSDRSFAHARDLSARRGDPDTLAGLVVATPDDRPGHIAWKALARSDVLLARRFESEAIDATWLDWDACEDDPETRLCRLAGQIIAAARTDSPFGLRLPGVVVQPAHGSQHSHRCFRALALWRTAGETTLAEEPT